ncbi:MAG: CoA transferase [Nevskia sp.]|nr:CoA transferase [Nevskia sp.]
MNSIANLRVLELSGSVAGAYCTKLFAGLGAQVDRLPQPGATDFPLTPEDHLWFNAGKRDLAIAAGDPDTRQILERLIAASDIVVDDWGLGALAGFGLDPATLQARWPQLVYCQITPFGAHGPYRDFQADDITLYAMAGLMHSTGDGARAPLNAQPKVARVTAGLNAYVGCMIALLRTARDGIGESIDLSVQESAIENYETAMADCLHLGKIARRNNDNHGLVPWRTYPTADGTLALIGGPVRNWLKAAQWVGEPRLLSPEFAHMRERIAKRAEFEALLKPWLLTQNKRELFERGQQAGLAWGYIATLPEALDDVQLQSRKFFVEAKLADGRVGRMPGAPFRGAAVSWTDSAASRAAVPAADAVADSATRKRVINAKPIAATAKRLAPLAGIKVVDFTHDWAGPHATRVLADYGADIFKVEYPKRLDSSRGGYKKLINEHPRFWNLHRGKQAAALDLKDSAQLEACRELIRGADILIENSRPGVMARKGLSYEQVRELRPDIIMLSMSGFGAEGPRRNYAGYGANLEALSGIQSLTAYDDQSPRYRVREMDVLNSILGAGALLSALWHRQLTGEGQLIDFSELEGCAWYIGEHFLRASLQGQPPVLGNRHAQFAPQGCYPCAGEDRWLAVTIRNDAEWSQLATLIGATQLANADLATRRAQHEVIDALITAWTRQQDASATMHLLQAQGIAAGMVFSSADLAADPHLAARQWFLETPDGRFPGLPFRLPAGESAWRGRGPSLGQHNAELFAADRLPDLGPDSIGTAYEMF